MSMFLPDGVKDTPALGTSSITPANPETTQEDIALMQRVLAAAARNPNLMPTDFMAYLVDYMQTSRLEISIGQVFGFSKFTANVAVVTTFQTRTSSTFGDLTTVGPQLTLPDGKYLVLWGAQAAGSPAVSVADMIVQSGLGASTDNAIAASSSVGSSTSLMAGDTITLKNGGQNSLITKYRSSDNTFACSWQQRFLIALRMANA